ncbi:hypothetical protein [Mycolicibacterium sp. XJ870]
MDLKWWLVAIIGCVALAGCVAFALLLPHHDQQPQPLANTGRLTRLPEYVRALRLRTISAFVAMALLVVIFTATALAAARPTGLPSSARNTQAAQPEDIMVCVGGPVTDAAVGATLRYFAERVTSFGADRIGLTSANRRVVPLTRDYQYAAAQFGAYTQSDGQRDDGASFVSPVSYVDYAENAGDVLALCLTGFPSFEEKTAQRRSLIYVGPEATRAGPQLFTEERIRDVAVTAGVQINVLTTDSGDGALAALARSTGGRAYAGAANVPAHLTEIRQHPPQASSGGETVATTTTESPDIPLAVALLALTALSLWSVVVRR